MTVQRIDTRYGEIKVSSPGPKIEYDNLNIYHQTQDRVVRLQGPALRAFKAAEAALSKNHRRIIKITGIGYRDWYTQYALWRSDDQRYANPDSSMHVEGLAVDVDTGQRFKGKTVAQTQHLIREALEDKGFHFGVGGEPWHCSFHVVG